MFRILFAFIAMISLSIPFSVHANELQDTELQGYGAFSHLNKDWMLMALYQDDAAIDGQPSQPQRLEIKVSSKKISSRRFRALWLETLAVEHGTEKVAAMQADLQQFFNLIQGPLKKGDALVIERTESGSEIKLNYHSLATLSADFLPDLVQSLTGKHPPTQALKAGLKGEDSLRGQTNLSIRFERLEPSLPRIAEVSRWGKTVLASN